jgi:hypothetical protein
MVSTLAPRALVLRGHYPTHGFVVEPSLVGESEARARVLAAWRPGTVVRRLRGGALLCVWPSPERRDVGALPGLAVVERDGAWCTLPLTDAEWLDLAPVPPGALVYASAGRAVVELEAPRVVDPAEWIDVDDVVPLSTSTLGAPPRAIARPAPAQPPPDLRAQLLPPGRQAPTAELARVVEALRRAERGEVVPAVEATRRESWWQRVAAWWRTARTARPMATAASEARSGAASLVPARPLPWWRRLAAWLGRGASPATTPPPTSSAVSVAGPAAASRLSAWLQRWARLRALAPWAGKESARYLSDMLDKFERGDLAEALRHAIPLGGAAGLGERVGAGLPAPRTELRISPRSAGGVGSSLVASEDLYAHLRRVYTSAFERLEREGRHEEAAFVLAELLQRSEEAVSFLERHGKLRLAAELAEARGLEPALVVRQWMVAGDVERAVALAREHGVFASALTRLERSHPEHARRLRVLWADLCADAGDFERAVEVVWPVQDARALALGWIDRAMEVGGAVRARMIARKIELRPEAYPELRAEVLASCAERSASAALDREVLAQGLMAVRSEAAQRLAFPLVRAVVEDRARGWSTQSSRELRTLADFAGQRALRGDLPELDRGSLPTSVHHDVHVKARDVGRTPLYDAALLPNGRLLVALGEGGVVWLTPDGRRVAHFDVPAHQLVVSDHGDRALALAPRGELTRVSKLDLRARGARHWLDLELHGHADTFDGSVWYVLERRAVVALDLLARRPHAVWRVEPDGAPMRVARTATSMAFAAADGAELEVWTYQLPTVSLRARRRLPLPESCALAPDGRVLLLRDGRLVLSSPLTESKDPTPSGEVLSLVVGANGEAGALWRTTDGCLATVGDGASQVRVRLDGTTTAFVRLSGRHVLVGDREGRVLLRALDARGRSGSLRL